MEWGGGRLSLKAVEEPQVRAKKGFGPNKVPRRRDRLWGSQEVAGHIKLCPKQVQN